MTPLVHIDRDAGLESPDDDSFYCWVDSTLKHVGEQIPANPEVSFRINDASEMAALNLRFRSKDGPTNVLSFPADLVTENTVSLLGDIAICAPVVAAEAAQQAKPVEAHWAHLTVHGVLHLVGYDHLDSADAQKMESLEIKILADLGFKNPYTMHDEREHAP
jgi:probable rRNA maturation factor